MSTGHAADPAGASAVVTLLQRNPGLRAHVSRPPIISRAFRVPYLAGSSIDGSVVYIDAQTPERFADSGVEPDAYFAAHEMMEWWLMTRLGMPYDPPVGRGAHPLAHGFEHLRMKLDGIDDARIEQYEQTNDGLVNIDEHLRLPPEAFPPDLYLGPYESDGDSLDARLLPQLRTAAMMGRTISYG